MKRVGYIYEKVYDKDNIIHAMYKASLGKRNQIRVKKVLENADYYALKIKEMLMNKTYAPSKPDIKVIQDGANKKERTIFKPKFYPDQIIHWSLMLQIEPIIMKGMYAYSCGSVPKRGTSLGQKMIRQWLDKDRRNTKWCLKMDIKKFYPSVKNEVLKRSFRRKIKDKDCLWLIDTIIDAEEGLPIGYYTSQWFANFVLEPLDHFIKEKMGVKYYVRYVDDLVLLGANKKKLHKVRKEVKEFLDSLGLTLKKNWQVFRLDKRDIDFLGLRFFRHKTILRKRNALRIRRRIKKIANKSSISESDASAVISYWGWIKRSDSYRYYHKHVKPYISISKARKVVSYYAKVRNHPEWGIINLKYST